MGVIRFRISIQILKAVLCIFEVVHSLAIRHIVCLKSDQNRISFADFKHAVVDCDLVLAEGVFFGLRSVCFKIMNAFAFEIKSVEAHQAAVKVLIENGIIAPLDQENWYQINRKRLNEVVSCRSNSTLTVP